MWKPNLAAKIETEEDLNKLKYPVIVSPKIDGIRATIQDGKLLSRKLKPIPSLFCQQLWSDNHCFEGLDGELVVGDITSPQVFNTTQSGVMSEDGTPDVAYWVFDRFGEKEFSYRYSDIPTFQSIMKVPHYTVLNKEQLLAKELMFLDQGYEGIMIRDPHGLYKQGRSTLREGGLIKFKRFEDSEAEIVGLEEQMHNSNEATKDELGRTKRSSHKSGMLLKGTLGALIVRDLKTGVEFSVGSGFDDRLRKDIWWKDNSEWIGKIITYRYQKIGSKDRPRFPTFKGFRKD